MLQLVAGGQIAYTEPRFLEDDLNRLVELDLLSLRFNRSGGHLYGITRNAVRLIEAAD